MGRFVDPSVFLIYQSSAVESGLQEYLDFLDVSDWAAGGESDAERLIELAGKSCYLSLSTDLNKNLTRVGARASYDYLQEAIIGNHHGSVLEHASVTIAMNCSRIVTHELIRHRAGTAFSQESGRYVRKPGVDLYLPACIEQNAEAVQIFIRAQLQAEQNLRDLERIYGIDQLKNFDLKKELTSAFRRINLEGRMNVIIMTANHRALRHIISMRTNQHAEEEIRRLFADVFAKLVDRYPALYADAIIAPIKGINQVTFRHEKV